MPPIDPSVPDLLVSDLFVETCGDGPPVVVVPGLGATTNAYLDLATRLSARHRVTRFDLPGAGRSPRRASVALPDLVALLADLVDTVAAGAVTLVGHSFGTLIAQHLAARHPDRIAGLVLLGPIREQPPAAKAAARARAELGRRDGLIAVADALVAAATSSHTRAEHPLTAAFIRELVLGQPPHGYASLAESLADAAPADLSAITAPALLITGADDVLAPPAATEVLAADLPSASVRVLDMVGHWTALEAPEPVAAAITEFL